MAREEFVRKNPNATRAFMRAIAKAQEFISKPENEAELVRIAVKQMKQREDYIRASTARYQLRLEIEPVLESDMKTVGEFMKGFGRLKGNPPLKGWLYSDPLKSVRPDWVKLEGSWRP
jgi:ABC-type nitrate/sulfonate/bicarbonate transport system substrate-binding protein